MAGFEGPREPGASDEGSPKLPSWAITRKDPEPDLEPPRPVAPTVGTFPELGVTAEPGRHTRAEPPVVRVPEHPFDPADPFGDRLPGGESPWERPPADDTEVRVVDLADEFHLTTSQSLEICEALGAPVTSGAAWLTIDQAAAFREAVGGVDRSSSSDESFPSWAVPPGGRQAFQAPPVVGEQARPQAASTGSAAEAAASLLSDPALDDASGPTGGSRVLAIVLLVVAVVAIAALVAVLLTR